MATAPDTSPRDPKLTVRPGPPGPWQTVQVRGELDLTNSEELRDQVSRLINRQAPPRLALDLSQLTFCDSSGLNALIQLWKQARATDTQLVLLRPTPRMTDLLNRTGLDRFLPSHDTLPDATGTPPADPT